MDKAPETSWTDGELVELFRSGNELAFAELVHRYQVRVFRLLLGVVRDESLAEEIAQQAFVKASLRIEQLEDGQAFYAWLVAIARTSALDELRKRKLRDHETLDDVTATTEYAEDLETREAVHNVLAQLAPDERMALILAEMQGRSMKEVAVALSVSVSAAKMRVKRARDHFRELFVEQTK